MLWYIFVALVPVTPVIFVVFVVLTGSGEQSPCLIEQNRFVIFAVFVKIPFFWQGTKARLPKTPFCDLDV